MMRDKTDRRESPHGALGLPRFCLGLLIFVGAIHCVEPTRAQPVLGGQSHIKVSLVPESQTPASGAATTIAITMDPQPGWHGYWRTPGDSGLAPKFSWTLPAGVKAGDPGYPVPGMLVVDGLMNYVYDKPYALLVRLEVADGLPKATKLPIALKLDFLACTTSVCVPESASAATTLTVGDGPPDPASITRFALWRAALPRSLDAQGTFAVDQGRFRLAVPLPNSITVSNPHLFAETQDAISFAAPQSFSRQGDTLLVETAAVNAASHSFSGVLDLGGGGALELSAQPGPVPTAAASPGRGSDLLSAHGMWSLTLIAFAGAVLGGLILNVMPCVFPILSLKALSLARSAGDHRTARRESLAYAAGVIVLCVALGALILALRAAGTQVGWAFQLQKPAVIFVLILLTSAIGFNLAGLFEFGALTAGSGLASRTGTAGAFWTGALAAFVATPCTGPFMAAALGAALVLPVAAGLLIFVGLGFGLSLPFLAIGFIPALRRKLPKPGAWMSVFRHVLAVPMFLTAVGLAWVIGNQTGPNGIIVSLAAMLMLSLGLWIMGLRQRSLKERAWIPAAAALLLSLGGIGLLPGAMAKSGPAQTGSERGVERFDEQKLASLRAARKPVFLYLTAAWCLSCKVNEKAAIERPETRDAFAKANVVTMVGDWTNGDSSIGSFLESHGRSGVPLYLWYSPGKEARVLPQILTPSYLAALAQGAGHD